MAATNFYPSIKSIVSTKSIPVLDWIPDSSSGSLLDSIFYKDLQVYKDGVNSAVTYRLSSCFPHFF